MSKRNLLLCFDAFGTLFTPKRPIAQQYGEVARSLELGGFSDEQLQASFKDAFKKESKQNPNFGKANGMNAEQWWTKIIHNTFQPLTGSDQQIHNELAPRLLHRFSSEEGYLLYPDVVPLIQRLRGNTQPGAPRVVIGVITNSDDRVPDVLTALGLRVSPFRFGHQRVNEPQADQEYDIDFTVLSYDVGHEKPDKRIFTAAEDMLKADSTAADTDLASWDKVYIGDEYDKDVVGALDADWNAILIDRENPGDRGDVYWLDACAPGSLPEAFEEAEVNAVGFSSLAKLAQWLPKNT